MTDKTDPDMTDIDAFLIEDSTVIKAHAGLPNASSPRVSKARPPRNKSPIARLNSRITHVSRNIQAALGSANEFSEWLKDDQKGCDAIGEDIHDWDKVITALENVIHHIPESNLLNTKADNEDSLHEDITDVVASHLDTEVKKASEGPAEIMSAKVDDHTSSKTPPEQNHLQKPAQSSERKLLDSLEKQESRIRELEEQLESLQSTGTHSNPGNEPSNLHEYGDSNLNVNRLIVSMNGDDNTKYPLSRNIMTIGREPHNDIHIRSRYISRFHARIVSDQDGSVIEDLGSRNGVAVNAKKVRRRQLRSGDLIDLGRIQLKYIDLMEGSASEGQA
jgi:predicted  nucleic acid-binding Zn-ribbon protein